jgi:hypothetical protein
VNTNVRYPFKNCFIQSYVPLFVLASFNINQTHSKAENISLILSTGVSRETDKCTSVHSDSSILSLPSYRTVCLSSRRLPDIRIVIAFFFPPFSLPYLNECLRCRSLLLPSISPRAGTNGIGGNPEWNVVLPAVREILCFVAAFRAQLGCGAHALRGSGFPRRSIHRSTQPESSSCRLCVMPSCISRFARLPQTDAFTDDSAPSFPGDRPRISRYNSSRALGTYGRLRKALNNTYPPYE